MDGVQRNKDGHGTKPLVSLHFCFVQFEINFKLDLNFSYDYVKEIKILRKTFTFLILVYIKIQIKIIISKWKFAQKNFLYNFESHLTHKNRSGTFG